MKQTETMQRHSSIRPYLIRKLPVIMAFLIPVLILLILYIGREVFPFGENMYLRSDMYHQYAPFTREFQRILQNGGSLLYSWNIGLGNNFASTYAYYLASPANWLLPLLPDTLVPEFMNLMLILKSGLMSSLFAWYLIRKFRRNDYTATVFGCFYAMSAYMAAFSWNVMWLDCLVLFPLILYGLEALVKEGRFRLYVISLAVSIISNYYISIMICIFLVFYFLYLILCERRAGGPDVLCSICRFLVYSVIAGGMAMFIVLPALFNLFITASSDSSFPYSMTAYYNLLAMLSKSVINTEPAVFSGHYPNIYSTMAVFVLVPLYWIGKGVPAREKAGKTSLLFLLAFSFMFNIPTYIWHGFHFPNSLPCRYSFIYIFLTLVMAYQALISIRRFRVREIVLCALAGVLGVFVLQALYESEGLTLNQAFLGALFILFYLGISLLLKKKRDYKTLIMIALMVVSIAEILINTNETGYSTTSRTSYMRDNEEISQMLSMALDEPFYRVEKVTRKTKNDGTWNDYRSASVFSSTTVSGNSDLYSSLGMQGRTNAFSYYGHTPFTQALLGVRYEIAQEPQTDPLMTTLANIGDSWFYENKYALSLGFLVSHEIDDAVAPMSNPFGFQNGLIQDFTGLEEVFQVMDSYSGDHAQFQTRKEGRCLVYLTGDMDSCDVEITRDGEPVFTKKFDSLELPQIIDIGDVQKEDTVIISGNYEDGGYSTLYPAVMDYNRYEEAMEILMTRNMQITEFTDTKVRGHVSVGAEDVLFTTIPYDEGWSVYVDGEERDYRDFEKSFILVDLEPGEHEIEFRYWPLGLTAGIVVSGACTALFAGSLAYLYLFRKNRAQNRKKQK
ncbi:MAG: YfhO family protein [Parasporobacterium sp.]|nr:YfhO family protein [Parasporobacterium sp.]